MENENKTVETAEPMVYEKASFGTTVIKVVKENWWKALLVLTATAGSFAGGYAIGNLTTNSNDQEEPPFEPEPEL